MVHRQWILKLQSAQTPQFGKTMRLLRIVLISSIKSAKIKEKMLVGSVAYARRFLLNSCMSRPIVMPHWSTPVEEGELVDTKHRARFRHLLVGRLYAGHSIHPLHFPRGDLIPRGRHG